MGHDCFIANLPYLKISQDGSWEKGQDHVIKEERIGLFLNGKKLLSTMSIPQDQDAHAIGFLMSEGVIEDIKDVQEVRIEDGGLNVRIQARIKEENLIDLHKEKTLTSGCCVGVTGNFEGRMIEKFIASTIRIPIQLIWDTLHAFYEDNAVFEQTGCVHQALLINAFGERLTKAMDVGRHNAIDKAVGKARMQHIPLDEALLFVSGRLSLEMVIKTAMHEIPIVVSRSASTALAIEAAQKLGITLIGFARDGRCNVYTHSSRILHP